jgi:fermentation-respiration switch protein FrsA (DUF1100 family)
MKLGGLLLTWSTVACAIVAGLFVFVRLVESRLAFFPEPGEPVAPASIGIEYESLTLRTSDGETLRGWWMPRPDAAATVFYLHGNGGNLSLWLPGFARVWQQGYAVFAVDYRGYGASTGSPSEAGLYRDLDASLEALAKLDTPRPIVYWGRSLGSVMAAYAATQRAPDGLILEAGFPDARAVLEGSPLWLLSWLSSYRFPAARWLEGVAVPTLVIHGDRDSVIPFHLGERLYERVRGPKRFFRIEGGDHNDLQPRQPGAYWAAVGEFVASVGGASTTPDAP